MTREEARHYLSVPSSTNGSGRCTDEQHYEAKQIAIKALEQEPCDDVVSRQAIMKLKRHNLVEGQFVSLYDIEQLPSVRPQEPQESEKVNCKSTKCENCINHNYCDYEPRESEEISERNMKMWQDIFEEEKRRAE